MLRKGSPVIVACSSLNDVYQQASGFAGIRENYTTETSVHFETRNGRIVRKRPVSEGDFEANNCSLPMKPLATLGTGHCCRLTHVGQQFLDGLLC